VLVDPPAGQPDAIDRIQQAWRRQRPDVDVSSIAVLSRVTRIARHLERARHRALAELGTDAMTLDVLATLRRSGAPFRLTAGELQRAALITSGAVTQRLDRLEAAGLVRRQRGGPDKRSVYVSLTGTGRALIDKILAGLMQREERLLDPLTPGQRQHLQELLRGWLLWLEHNDPD
jgi:DNA-binding MarR family transcriptional regulator